MNIVGSAHASLVFGRRIRVLSTHIAELLPPGSEVLDIGCGDGSLARLVMKMRSDVAISGAEVLQRTTAHIPVQIFDGRTLPNQERSVDVAMLVDVLHHAEEPSLLLAEAARVSRTAVLVKDHFRKGMFAEATLRLMDWVGNAHHGVALPYNYLTPDEWRSIFAKAGLRLTSMRRRLGLYPRPASWLFDRNLHFIALLTPDSHIALPTA